MAKHSKSSVHVHMLYAVNGVRNCSNTV